MGCLWPTKINRFFVAHRHPGPLSPNNLGKFKRPMSWLFWPCLQHSSLSIFFYTLYCLQVNLAVIAKSAFKFGYFDTKDRFLPIRYMNRLDFIIDFGLPVFFWSCISMKWVYTFWFREGIKIIIMVLFLLKYDGKQRL